MSYLKYEKYVQVDKVALDALNDGAEAHLQGLEPWVQVWSRFSATPFSIMCMSNAQDPR
jgi:NCK-associated protein 1